MKKPSLLRRFRDLLRANFVAGMFVALPLAITVGGLYLVWQKIDAPLKQVFKATQQGDAAGGIWEGLLVALSAHPKAAELVRSLLGLGILLVAVFVLGMVIRSILGKYLLSVFDGALMRVPIAGSVYNALRQLAVAFVDDTGKSKFRRAVLVQFPVAGSWAIGFETGTAYELLARAVEPAGAAGSTSQKDTKPVEYVTVFVPTTPLPTQGFTLLLPRTETRELPMSVQEAMKLVISGGILTRSDETMRSSPDAS